MKYFFNYIREKYSKVYIVILFLLTAGVIVYMMPNEGKFKYEFQKGSPWLHEDLIAPYDFPIYKTEAELKAERDSVKNNSKLYYRHNGKSYKEQFKKIEEEIDIRWDAQNLKYDSLCSSTLNEKQAKKLKLLPLVKNKYKKVALKSFETIYKLGVIEIPDIFDEVYKNTAQDDILLKIMKENVSEDYYFNEVFTSKTAYEYLMEGFYELNPTNEIGNDRVEKHFIENLNLNDFIVPNLIFDRATTEKVKNSQLESISFTESMVQAGQLIILKGDVVNEEKFKILESLRKEYETDLTDNTDLYMLLGGQLIIVASSLLILVLFLFNFRQEVLQSALKSSFILLIFIVTLFNSILFINKTTLSIYLIPFAIQPILIRTFFDSRLAIFLHLITILLVGFVAPNGFEFVFLQFIAGVIAVLSIANLYTRGQLFISSVFVFLAYSFVYFGIAIIQESSIENVELDKFLLFAINSAFVLFSYPAIYIFEKIFGFVSDVTLIELSDTNRPLLRRLAEQAPGTFQHSMQVANLAEAAVRRIGGNPLLVRTGALYHDIGKMLNSTYFTENQNNGINPHDQLDFDRSAEIIIDHVISGVELGKRYKLPESIIDFIRTHHGMSKVRYFYISFKNKYPDKEVDISKFMYPGPLPHSKETSVLMMVDSIEAASRSLKSYSKDSIKNLVDTIIDNQIKDGQFDFAQITFSDISEIKDEVNKKLMNIYHTRIEYPKEKNKN